MMKSLILNKVFIMASALILWQHPSYGNQPQTPQGTGVPGLFSQMAEKLAGKLAGNLKTQLEKHPLVMQAKAQLWRSQHERPSEAGIQASFLSNYKEALKTLPSVAGSTSKFANLRLPLQMNLAITTFDMQGRLKNNQMTGVAQSDTEEHVITFNTKSGQFFRKSTSVGESTKTTVDTTGAKKEIPLAWLMFVKQHRHKSQCGIAASCTSYAETSSYREVEPEGERLPQDRIDWVTVKNYQNLKHEFKGFQMGDRGTNLSPERKKQAQEALERAEKAYSALKTGLSEDNHLLQALSSGNLTLVRKGVTHLNTKIYQFKTDEAQAELKDIKVLTHTKSDPKAELYYGESPVYTVNTSSDVDLYQPTGVLKNMIHVAKKMSSHQDNYSQQSTRELLKLNDERIIRLVGRYLDNLYHAQNIIQSY